MKNFSKIALTSLIGGALTLGLAGTALAASNTDASAIPKDPQAKHEAMNQAMDQGYDAWAALMAENPKGKEMLSVINKDNFSKLQEAHKLREQAHALMDQAKAIHTELGLPQKDHGGFGPGKKGKMAQRLFKKMQK